MTKFTKEQLQEIAQTDHVQCGDAAAMARQLLAGLEQEPVGWMTDVEVDELHRGLAEEAYIYRIADCASTIPLYRLPLLEGLK